MRTREKKEQVWLLTEGILVIPKYNKCPARLPSSGSAWININQQEEEEIPQLEEVDEETLDMEEKAALEQKRRDIERMIVEREIRKKEREKQKIEAEKAKIERRRARAERNEAKELARQERQSRRDEGEDVESLEEEEILDPDELADIEAERQEEEDRIFRETRWPDYVRYVDSLVSRQIMKAIQSSLELFETQMNVEKGPNVAFVEVIAELKDPDIDFTPSLDVEEEDGLYYSMRELMKDMFCQATLFPRIDPIIPIDTYEAPSLPLDILFPSKRPVTHWRLWGSKCPSMMACLLLVCLSNMSYEHSINVMYGNDIAEESGLIDLYHEISKRIENSINDVIQYAKKYEKYGYLWLDDRQEVLADFLKYGRIITPEEMDRIRYETGADPPETKPTLESYQEEINKYNNLYNEVSALPTNYLFNGWLKLEMKRLNQLILNIICKWSNLYKQNLKDYVQNSLDDLEAFIAYASKELSVDLADDDYDGLLKIMGVLGEVRSKQDQGTDTMFDPLRDIMYVLKDYGVEFPEDTYDQLDMLPEKWRNLVRLSTMVRNNIAPLQATQAALVTKRVALINLRLTMYREKYKRKDMFLECCAEPYMIIDSTQKELVHYEDIVEYLNKSCSMFDLQPPEQKFLKLCRKELKLIKKVKIYSDEGYSSDLKDEGSKG
ncbi:Dynein heavy chain 17, axonemal [Eumeta japonica]|uniref:Dynein heavy chain 17, axonemal n=1 Tax=Eumeta variegata TaxID=151549 RepID=A0A4C1XBB6_EUMVA|nr:Dynein heavy chain 17, axonemal [Eumeta japonica]